MDGKFASTLQDQAPASFRRYPFGQETGPPFSVSPLSTRRSLLDQTPRERWGFFNCKNAWDDVILE